MIRLLLADDHALLREGLTQLLSFFDGMGVTGEAASGDEVLLRLADDTFDIVLLDVNMPGISGAELVARIREDVNNPPILMLTMHNEPLIAKRMLDAGATGFLSKDCSPYVLEDAIRKVAAGGRYLLPEMAEAIIFLPLDAPTVTEPAPLSPQEQRVFDLLAQGMRVVDIARELDINTRTVSTYTARLMHKLDIEDDAALKRNIDVE